MPVLVKLINLIIISEIVGLREVIGGKPDHKIVLIPLQSDLFLERHQSQPPACILMITAVLHLNGGKMYRSRPVGIHNRPVQKDYSVRRPESDEAVIPQSGGPQRKTSVQETHSGSIIHRLPVAQETY